MKKTAKVLEGDNPGGGAFALFLRPNPGAFRQLMCPHPEEFAKLKKKKNGNARGLARGVGMGTAGIDWCINLSWFFGLCLWRDKLLEQYEWYS